MAHVWTVCLCLAVLSWAGVLGQGYPTAYMYNNCGSSIDVSNIGYISWSAGSYSNNVDCYVVLLAPSGSVISLQFPNVNIEGSCIDYLYVYDGEYYYWPGFDSAFYVCTNHVPSGFSSTGNYVTLRLKTDGSVTGSFQVLYTVLGSISPTPVASGRIRLVGGSTSNEGRLEVRPEGSYSWGTVCDDGFGMNDATVACRMLGYSEATEVRSSAYFGQGSGDIYMDDLQCSGDETSLFSCSYAGWGVHNCGHSEDVGIVCGSPVASSRIRLVGGSTSYEGRLEVRPADSYDWGTVCDDSFGTADAHVACRTLGYLTALEYRDSAAFGEGSGQIYMDDLGCSGTESNLFECSYRGWGVHDCSHSEDVGVVCSSSVDTSRIRLVGGSTIYEGRVEVRPVGSYTWGTVCDDSFDILDATVVCRTLGYSGALEYRGSASFGQGSGPIYMDDLACTGSELSLFSCSYSGWGVENCGHSEDIGVVCTSSGVTTSPGATGDSDRVRLVGGTAGSEGRLEVRPEYNYDWGTVCDDDFGMADADVVCRMLGYSGANRVRGSAYYGRGSGYIYMDDVACSGSESSLFDCSYPGWGIEDCGHSEDVGIECNTSGTSLSGGAIAGIVLGVLGSIILLATLVACACKSSSSSSATNRVIPATHGRRNIAMTANTTIVHQPTVVTQNPASNPQYNPQQIFTVYQPYPQPPQYPPPPAYTDALSMPTQPPGGTRPQLQPLSSQLYPPTDPAYPPTYIPPQQSLPYSGVPPPGQQPAL